MTNTPAYSLTMNYPRAFTPVMDQSGFEICIQNDQITIKGRSIGPPASKKLGDLLGKMENLVSRFGKIQITFDFEIFDSNTAAYLFRIIKSLNGFYHVGRAVKVTWVALALDDDMIETGLDYSQMCDFPLEFRLK